MTADNTMWETVLHAGLAGSFLKVPYVPAVAAEVRGAAALAAVYGIPFDSTSISRTGASYGPRAVREATVDFLSYSATWDFDLRESLRPVDCGDCVVVPGNAEKTFAVAEAAIAEIVAAGAVPMTLGGDHSVTIPAVRAVARLSVRAAPGRDRCPLLHASRRQSAIRPAASSAARTATAMAGP